MRSVIALFVAASAVVMSPADILTSSAAPDGYELSSAEYDTLDFDEFAESSPYSVGHVTPGSAETDTFVGGQDVWTSATEDNVLLREVSVWSDPDVATEFVEQIVAYAGEEDLSPAPAPFGGSLAFSGDDGDVGIQLVVWQQGRVGVAVSHFTAAGTTDSSVIDDAAQLLVEGVTATTGLAVGTTGTTGETPVATSPTTTGASTGSGGGIPIGTVFLWLVVIIGGIWLFVKIRKKMRAMKGETAPPRSADDIIDDARTKARTERASADKRERAAAEERSTDDMIAEARKRAREDVDRASDQWQVPDDF